MKVEDIYDDQGVEGNKLNQKEGAVEDGKGNQDAADFMPETLSENLLEWVTFVFVRSTLTDMTTAGLTMNDAILELKGRLHGDETKLRVVRGLEVLKRNDQAHNQIDDPFFQGPMCQLDGSRTQDFLCAE